MYELIKVRDRVRVPASKFKEDLGKSIVGILQEELEGLIDEDLGVIIMVTEAKKLGPGRVIPGDDAAYYDAEIDLIVFNPLVHEVVEGKITEMTEFGCFAGIGTLEGLVHVSQIMDEYMNYDAKNGYFVGKETKNKIKMEDKILSRIVSVSLKGTIAESKMGLTMRQPFLGKLEWVSKEIKDKKRDGGKPEVKKEFKKNKKEDKGNK